MMNLFLDLEKKLINALFERDFIKLESILMDIKNYVIQTRKYMDAYYYEFIHDLSGKLTIVFLAYETEDMEELSINLNGALYLLLIYKAIYEREVDWINLEKIAKTYNCIITRQNTFSNEFLDFLITAAHILIIRGITEIEIDQKQIKIMNLSGSIWNSNQCIVKILKEEIQSKNYNFTILEDQKSYIITY